MLLGLRTTHWSTVMPSFSNEKRDLEIYVTCLNSHDQLGVRLVAPGFLFQALKDIAEDWAKFHTSVYKKHNYLMTWLLSFARVKA